MTSEERIAIYSQILRFDATRYQSPEQTEGLSVSLLSEDRKAPVTHFVAWGFADWSPTRRRNRTGFRCEENGRRFIAFVTECGLVAEEVAPPRLRDEREARFDTYARHGLITA